MSIQERLTRENLMAMDPDVLRSIIRERTHHTIEIFIYPAMYGDRELGPDAGSQVKSLLAVWEERDLPGDLPDIQWSRKLLAAAEALRRGETPDLDLLQTRPFSGSEMEVVDRLIFGRRSVRQFTDEDIEPGLIDKILCAAQWAPHACNLQTVRYLVLKTEEERSLINLDVRGYQALIVACQDSRIYEANPHVPEHNRLLDLGAATQNICLMAHALGLGACWATFRQPQTRKMREYFNVPDYIDIVTCVALSWPAEDVAAPARIDLEETVFPSPEA